VAETESYSPSVVSSGVFQQPASGLYHPKCIVLFALEAERPDGERRRTRCTSSEANTAVRLPGQTLSGRVLFRRDASGWLDCIPDTPSAIRMRHVKKSQRQNNVFWVIQGTSPFRSSRNPRVFSNFLCRLSRSKNPGCFTVHLRKASGHVESEQPILGKQNQGLSF
jgi:hypothetical protein